MKAQQENLILFFMLISQERDVQRLFLESFKMGLFNDVGDQTIHRQPGPEGPAGPQGPPDPTGPGGLGFKKTSDGNYDAEDKKLANLQKCVDEEDAANKKYVDDQFTLVMMTRNVFSKGISMQDGRIEGLPDPASELDAARKKYVDDRDKVMKDEMKNFSRTED